jgi:hypothetical protein
MKNHALPITLGWLLAFGLVAWVFSLYLQPEFALLVADQLWMCF